MVVDDSNVRILSLEVKNLSALCIGLEIKKEFQYLDRDNDVHDTREKIIFILGNIFSLVQLKIL